MVRADLERLLGLVVSLTPSFTTTEAKNPTKGRMCLSAQGQASSMLELEPRTPACGSKGPTAATSLLEEDAPAPATAMLN